MPTFAVFSKRPALALLLIVIIAGLFLSWLLPDGPLSRPKAATTTANDSIPAYNDTFRFGTNFGHRNESWSDSQYSDLAAGLGMNSFRVFLPENYLQTWGYNVALSNMQHYQAAGLKNLTANLGSPTAAHSSAPAGTADWQLDYYSPTNLYQPIWNADGSVNQNNYWANYVYKAVSTYKPYVKIWEIWNEPDFTDNWNATQAGWWNSPPPKTDLSRWNDSIFSYIRMLHVSYEVIKKVDPTALVATGGLGYESFLDAIVRYTDNPTDGSTNASYPLKGGAYFDVMSYHFYPMYGVQNLANGQWNTSTDSDNAVDNTITFRNNFQAQLAKRGYGTTYPAKPFIITETGFSSKQVGSDPGSMDLLRNFMMKVQVQARVSDIKQVHTYMLSDEEADTTLTSAYNHMGMYYDIANLSSTGQATRKAASYGVETLARTLAGATYDAVATAALKLPAGARGAVFQVNGQSATVLWARTANNSETAGVSLSLPATTSLTIRDWQWSQTKTTQTLTPANGQVQLTLTGAPVVVLGSAVASVPAPTATSTAPATATSTATPAPSATSTATPTKTVAPSATPTSAVVVPTATPTKTAVPTATPTKTVAPTSTPTLPPTATSAPSGTTVSATPQKLAVSGVTASTSDASHPASYLIDSNTNTYWSATGSLASAWVQLDLGNSRTVSQVRYFVYGTGHAAHTKVQYSADGVNWTTFSNANGIDTGSTWGWNTLNLGPQSARYLRFYLDNPSGDWELGYYSELQIWGN